MSVLMPIPDSREAEPADDEPTVTLWWLMRQLGHRRAGEASQIAYAQLLVDEAGLPPPYPSMIGRRGEQRLALGVTRKSQWARKPVEIWLEDFLPPANAAALETRALEAAAADMDAAAGNLRLVHSR